MKRFFLLGTCLSMSLLGAHAQNGTIGTSELTVLRKSYDKSDASTRALTNALTGNSLKSVALSFENQGKTDHLFKHKVEVSGITDQKSSGRCWMFTSLNTLRPKVMEELNVNSFEFSHSYLYFWDLLEKSNLFLENVIATAHLPWDNRYVEFYFKSPVDDGGVWNSYVNLVQKYGLVPSTVMPETNSSQSTSQLTSVVKLKLREQGYRLRELMTDKKDGSKTAAQTKVRMLGDIYRILCLHLGEPPMEFKWRYEKKDGVITPLQSFTPQEFAAFVLPEVDYTDYVMIMNDPTRPYYQCFEIENYRNTQEGQNWKYVNLPNDVIKELCISSIIANEALYASCDVGQQLNSKEGLLSLDNYDYAALYGMPFSMDKKARILTRESGSAHGMALVAVDTDNAGKPLKWQFENSWGSSSGHKGYLTFTDEWFNEFMFRFVIQKKFLTSKISEVLQQKPTMLPPWDPMF